MAKLTLEQIKEELSLKKFSLIDAENYKSLSSRIVIKCENGHLIETSLKDFRKASFVCPCCDRKIDFINPNEVPLKKGKRIIAFDQATEKFGLSIFDDNNLVFYSLYTFNGDTISRLVKIRKFINEIVIKEWKPDYIIMEDIQYQENGLLTFKVLAMLLGIVQECCAENNIKFEAVFPNVWRKYAGTAGKNRKEEKLLSVEKVKEKYNINVNDDVAESILIGHYAIKKINNFPGMAFGK